MTYSHVDIGTWLERHTQHVKYLYSLIQIALNKSCNVSMYYPLLQAPLTVRCCARATT